ncbi:MAG TPA: SRPBCC family protein [Jatrophihabitans sp.]|nr:SRPBCC family protein [Jatrophihabitans sp.]
MTASTLHTPLLFDVHVEVTVASTPDQVYALVTDLGRSGEWSEECLGGSWISGEPATVGAVFQGENDRSADVVAWAPVVRGRWSTESEVVTAEPGRVFEWAMRTKTGARQESVWGFEIEPAPGGGSRLVHRFRMGAPTEGIQGITSEMSPAEKEQFFTEWGAKLHHDMAVTAGRLKQILDRA